MNTNKPPEGNPERSFEESLERYQVYSPLEIGRILKGMQASKQLLRMSFVGTLETVIVSVLDVDIKGRMLMLDTPQSPAQNALALKSHRISFEGVLDRIKISFTADRAFLDAFNGIPALRVPFPERLVRLQRRDHFRLPISNSVVHIPTDVEGHIIYSVAHLRDLSTSGTCVVDASMMVDNTVGKIYTNCRLELPDTQPLMVTLEVRNSHEITAGSTLPQRRIGCQFVNLSAAEEALIQRYIARLERQYRTLT